MTASRWVPPRAIGLLLAVVTVAIVVANQHQVGLARDEIVYMDHGKRYAAWWQGLAGAVSPIAGAPRPALSREGITRTFGGPRPTDNNREHPPLMKTLFGLSYGVLHDGLGVDEITAFRAPSAALHGVLVLLVFLMVLELWGLAEATVAGLLVMFLPRAVFHAGLACFDAPITALWFATIYTYWRAIRGRGSPWSVGVVFGLALATKHNALLLPLPLALHYAIVASRAIGWRRVFARRPGVRGWRARAVLAGVRLLVAHRWRVIVALAVVGPAVLIALWPWLWLDPIGHIRDWLAFHLDHVHYNYEYLGDNWNAPPFPWHVALVTTLFTVPAATLAAAAIGVGVWIRGRAAILDRAAMPGLLLALSAAAAIGPFLLGSTPIFGAAKHWMPALPSICIAGGVGAVWAARRLAALVPPGGVVNHRLRQAITATACAAVVGAAAVETATAQPYALTWYNAIAGGAPGGADLGMNRQFWGVAAPGVFDVLRADARGAARTPVYAHDAAPAWRRYLRRGDLPRTLPDAGPEVAGIAASRYALVIHELHFNRHDYLIWKAYGTVQPMFVLRAAGVPVVTLYKRPVAPAPAERPPP